MERRYLFRFKSITHRLIFGCVAAALLIYGVSYWHARKLLHTSLTPWMTDLAQSRIDAAANEIETKLIEIEQNVLLTLKTQTLDTQFKANSTDQRFSHLLTLVNPTVEAISLIHTPNAGSDRIASGWHYQQRFSRQPLVGEAAMSQLDPCLSTPHTKTQPFWTAPHPVKGTQGSYGITYCLPLFASSYLSDSPTNAWIVVEVNLDWLMPLINQRLRQSDQVHYLELGDPFVLSTVDGQWLVKPPQAQISRTILSEYPQALQEGQNPAERKYVDNSLQDQFIQAPVHTPKWIVGIYFSQDKIEGFLKKYLWIVIFSMSKDMILMCVVIALISQFTTRSLRALNISTEEMAKGNLNTLLPAVATVDEVGRLTASFRRMQDSLLLHIQDLQETTIAKQKLESELSIAAQIQRTMLPRIRVETKAQPFYNIAALLKPARIVGGDFYDFFLLEANRLCLIIGDVADKGFPAALLMARTVTLIRTLTQPHHSPSQILANVNSELCTENEECLFVTVFCAILDLGTGYLIYASAGHDAPILIRDRKAELLSLETAAPLGLNEGADFPQHECVLYANDLLFLYTDGLTEAMNAKGELFSETRLIDLLSTYPPKNPTRALRTIQFFCQQFVGDAQQSDDLTLLAIQFLPSNPFLQTKHIMEWNLTLNNQLTELEELKRNLGEILTGASLVVELIENSQLITEEILVNIIHYSDCEQIDCCIHLRIEIEDQCLIMTFIDSGKPFNPLTDIPRPDLESRDEKRELGGFGFFLVQELSDRLEYAYVQGKNQLTVYQTIPKAL